MTDHADPDRRRALDGERFSVWEMFGPGLDRSIAEVDATEYVKSLEAALAAGERERQQVEDDLRREWWLNHGHGIPALYGDDGEMACNACMADFKRDPLERLRDVVFVARAERAAAVLAGEEDATPPEGDTTNG